MRKNKKLFTWAAVLAACLALAAGAWGWSYAKDHPKIQIASPFEQLERAQQQKPLRLEALTQLNYPSQTFELALKQGENRIRARTAYSPDGWAAYYRVLSLDPELSLGRYTNPSSFRESVWQDFILLEPADPKEAQVSSLTYQGEQGLITAAAPYRYLMARDPAQGWIAFSEGLTPEQALALLEQETPLDWKLPPN